VTQDVPSVADAGTSAEPGGASGPVLLALSTYRQSDRAVDLAIEKARRARRLVVVNVADVNLARYMVGTDAGLYPEVREQGEQSLLRKHEEEARRRAEAIAERARAEGIETQTRVEVGRFGLVCLRIMREERPSLVVTTRSRRPEWVRRFFGSPVDFLIANAGCPVVAV
jgi:nucleotide-binding universal stress UspA family protein